MSVTPPRSRRSVRVACTRCAPCAAAHLSERCPRRTGQGVVLCTSCVRAGSWRCVEPCKLVLAARDGRTLVSPLTARRERLPAARLLHPSVPMRRGSAGVMARPQRVRLSGRAGAGTSHVSPSAHQPPVWPAVYHQRAFSAQHRPSGRDHPAARSEWPGVYSMEQTARSAPPPSHVSSASFMRRGLPPHRLRRGASMHDTTRPVSGLGAAWDRCPSPLWLARPSNRC
jgi:hypothetical protein